MPRTSSHIYEQVETYINSLLEKGDLKLGNPLPTERELSRMFNASRIPVRQALQKLERNGVIERHQGKGTFVKDMPFTKQDTGKVGVLYSHDDRGIFTSSTHASMLKGIDNTLRDHDKDLLFKSLHSSPGLSYTEKLYKLAGEVDGIIIVDSQRRVYEQMEPAISTIRSPLVVLFYEGTTPDTDFIITDSRTNVRRIVSFLAENGHRSIGCTYYQEPWDTGVRPNHLNRVLAFKEGLAENGLTVREDFIFCTSQEDEAARLDAMLGSADRPTALFCTTAIQGSRIYHAAERAGLRVPDDLSVVGYGDSLTIATMDPPLTTLRHPLEEMGRAAVNRLMEKIEEKKQGKRTTRTTAFPGEMVVRRSHTQLV